MVLAQLSKNYQKYCLKNLYKTIKKCNKVSSGLTEFNRTYSTVPSVGVLSYKCFTEVTMVPKPEAIAMSIELALGTCCISISVS